jgi:hypothetical protein
MKYYVRLVQGKGAISRLIEFKDSDWPSHVEFLETTDNDVPRRVLSSRYPNGVQFRAYDAYPLNRDIWFSSSISISSIALAWTSMLKLVGHKYDLIDIFGITFDKDWHADGRYICSEAVAWAFEDCKYPIFNTGESVQRIRPSHFLLTPDLRRYKVVL